MSITIQITIFLAELWKLNYERVLILYFAMSKKYTRSCTGGFAASVTYTWPIQQKKLNSIGRKINRIETTACSKTDVLVWTIQKLYELQLYRTSS